MLKLSNLFGNSPFESMMLHMEKVAACVDKLNALFEALELGQCEQLELIGQQISSLEHAADLTKNDIRNHLPKSLFLPIDRSDLLEILSLQDALADRAEDIAVLINLKPSLRLPLELKDEFQLFFKKSFDAFKASYLVIEEFKNLVHTSFGGAEAQKVRDMVHQVAFYEHEVDIVQRQLLKNLFSMTSKIHYDEFYLWIRLFEHISSLSNLAEKLANRVRRTLDLR